MALRVELSPNINPRRKESRDRSAGCGIANWQQTDKGRAAGASFAAGAVDGAEIGAGAGRMGFST